MPSRKGRKANATRTATQPPTIEPQQEPTPDDASRQVEQDIPPPNSKLNPNYIIAICNTATGTIWFVLFED